MVTITNSKELQNWLETQPREIVQVFALRVALRVFPLLGAKPKRIGLIMTVARALFVARAAHNYPRRNIFPYAARAAHVANWDSDRSDSDGAVNAAADAYHAAAAVADPSDAVRHAVQAAGSPAIAADAFLAGDVADVTWLGQQDRFSNRELAQQFLNAPLWLNDSFNPVLGAWQSLKIDLSKRGNGWDIWTDWYDNRLAGQPYDFSLLPVASVDVIADIAMEDDPFWKRPHSKVNGDIKARLTPPILPQQGVGPHFHLDGGQAVFTPREDLDETTKNNLPRLRSLQPLLQVVSQQGVEIFGRNRQHAFVLTYLQMYAAAIKGPAENLDYDQIAGLGLLLAQAEAAANREIADRLKGEFEDDEKTILSGLLDLHGPFILASGAGQDLLDDADRYQRDIEQERLYREDGVALIEAGAVAELLGEKEAEFSKAAASIAGEGPTPERSAAFSSGTVRNIAIVMIGGGVVGTAAAVASTMFAAGAPIPGSIGAAVALLLVEGLKKSEPFQKAIQSVTSLINASADFDLAEIARYEPFARFVLEHEDRLRRLAGDRREYAWLRAWLDWIKAKYKS